MDFWRNLRNYNYFVDLSENDRAIIMNVSISFLYFSIFVVAYLPHFNPAEFQYVNLNVTVLMEKISLLSIAVMGCLLLFTLYCRKKNPASELPNNIQIYFIGHPLMVFAVMNGITGILTGLLLGVLPFIGLILLNRRHVFYATVLMWLEMMVLAICVSLNVLPNAPLYIQQVKPQHIPFLFFITQIFVGLPTSIAALLKGYALMKGLALREEEILELSRKDGLTKIWNRRYLNEVMEKEIDFAYRNSLYLSVIIMDLDYFKEINDTFGHQAGDSVLVTTAKTLQKTVRSADYVGRFGGEEFLIIVPCCAMDVNVDMNVGMGVGVAIAERCRKTIEEQHVEFRNQLINVTGSFGVTTIFFPNAQQYDVTAVLDRMISAADKALYKAKLLGRNRIVFENVL